MEKHALNSFSHATAPSAPLAVVAEAASPTSVNVTWSPPSMPNGIIRHYQVTYTRNDVMDAALQMTNTSGPAIVIQLSGLERFANYTITVRGFTVALGEASAPVSVRTNEDGESNTLSSYYWLIGWLMFNS